MRGFDARKSRDRRPQPAFSDPISELTDCLKKKVVSYGFAFVGLSDEVTGKLSMDELELAKN